MVTIEILRDNREQKPWEFDNFDVKTKDVTLETGDYSLATLCDHDEELDTYYPEYAIERKSGDDFISSITQNRKRFENEIKRASEWDSPLLVLIEEPKEATRYSSHFIDYFDIDRSQVFGTVEKWERYYNVKFNFAGTREHCQQIADATLRSQLRAGLLGD
jgi:ERCC4-type nuclease